MIVKSYAFTHSALAQFSEEERVALFHLGHLHNELLWSQKHLRVWNNRQGEIEPETNGRVFAFVSSIARFAGQLRETYKAIRVDYFSTQLSKKYHARLTPQTQAALDSLGRYYAGRNMVMEIRDKLAFHFDGAEFKNHIATLSPNQPHRFLIGEHSGNTFFEFAHNVNASCLLALSGEADTEAAMTRLVTEVIGDVADWTFRFITEFIILVLRETQGVAAEITLQNVPLDSDVHLPFFTRASARSDATAVAVP